MRCCATRHGRRDELETISHAEERIGQLETEEHQLLADLGRHGAELSAARRAAGDRMAQAIEAELADLQMARARFAVSVRVDAGPNGAIVDLDSATRIGRQARSLSPSMRTAWTRSPFSFRPILASRSGRSPRSPPAARHHA